MTVMPQKRSFFDPQRIFDLLLKALLIILGIIMASFFLFYIIRGEYTGFFLLLFIIMTTLLVFRIYWSAIDNPSSQVLTPEYEVTGDLEALADMIFRAACGLEYSREKLEAVVRELTGEDIHLHGNGESFVRSLKEALDEE
jgi:hypothetical protein